MIFQLRLNKEAGEVRLPLNYNHILEGTIYGILGSDPKYSAFLHDQGYEFAGKTYKFLTFSPLQGNSYVENQMIFFRGEITWEIRSPDPYICTLLQEFFEEKKEIRLGSNHLHILEVQINEVEITNHSYIIRMLSPLVMSHTEDKKTIYHNPLENDFTKMINANFRKKFEAAYQQEPPSDIKLLPLRIGYQDKYVGKYKGDFWINGWKGEYLLKGDPFSIRFVYETGLGVRNIQGFGMFEIIQ